MSRADRYKDLLDTAIEAGYRDEFEKLGAPVPVKPIITIGSKAAPVAERLAVEAVVPAAKKSMGFLARHGKRLLYGLTGKGLGKAPSATLLKELEIPGAAMKSTKELSEEAAKELASPLRSPLQWLKTQTTGKAPSEQALKSLVAKRQAEQEAAHELFRLTGGHIPGSVKAMATQPIKTMGTSLKAMGPGEKAFLGGMTAYQLAGMRNLDEMTPEERGEYLASTAVGVPLWLGTGGLTALPQMAAWEIGADPIEAAGRAIGRAVSGKQEMSPEEAQLLREQIAAQQGENQ